MKYAVIGTGAIGGYYGGLLAKAGNEVHFLFHKDYDYVKEHGLQVNSCNGNFHLDRVKAYNTTSEMPKSDIIIVSLKTTNNYLLPTLLTPLLHEHSVVLLIQNGIGVEEDVQKMFPKTQLLAGLAFICSAKTEPGCVNHQAYGSINIGNYSCKESSILEHMLNDFNNVGIVAKEVPYEEARWRKAVWNMPFNGMTVVMNTTTNVLLANESMMHVIREMMLEVIHASIACGVTTIPESFVDTMIQMTIEMVPYSPSMKLDHDYNRKMEIDYLYTRPIQIAHQHGFCMPHLETLEAQLRIIESLSQK